MLYLYILTAVAVIISFLANRQKTIRAFKIAFKRFSRMIFPFLTVIILISIALFLFPETFIARYLGGGNTFIGVLLASILGSVTLMPGFIAYPLAGILLKKGVSYIVLSAFVTTLMMVGVLTYPVEKEYFGAKVTILRNAIGLLIALCVAIVTGIFFGELF